MIFKFYTVDSKTRKFMSKLNNQYLHKFAER